MYRIPLSRPHLSGREEHYLSEAIASNFIAPVGPQLDMFEAAVERYLGQDLHCVAVSSGSAALHLALRIAGVNEGDTVWVSSMTFAGGVFPVNYLGASPAFFDLSPVSWTIDVNLVADVLQKAARSNCLPKAIVPTDLYGQSVDVHSLCSVAANYGVKVIIDSAESLGSEYLGGCKAGSGGDASILSFNGNKIITTSGGGMLVTPYKSWANEARFLSTQARDPAPHYQHSTYGYNYRLSNLCAAVGIGQMEVLDERVRRRRDIFFRYRDALARDGVEFMPEPQGYKSSRWLSVCRFDPKVLGVSREDVLSSLHKNGIEARPMWKPMHLQPLYAGSAYFGSRFDENLFETGLCLPSGSDMSESEQMEVIEIIQNTIHQNNAR